MHVFPYLKEKFGDYVLLTNSWAEHLFISNQEYSKFENAPESCSIDTINQLKSRFFICEDDEIKDCQKIIDIKYRTKHSYLENETLLLLVIPTISCNCSCIYCQVTSKKDCKKENDMSFKTALAFCDFVFSLPHKNIKIEFQGGEASLRFDLVEFISRRISFMNKKHTKNIEYVICTNLLELTNHEIKILKKYNIVISTSLDGSKKQHDLNRPSSKYESTYEKTVQNIALARKNKLYPSAIVTVTAQNLENLEEIIDTYVENKFEHIFIRPLNNYGYAFNNKKIFYTLETYMKKYKEAINYLINLNLDGKARIQDEWVSIILRKILSPFNDGFVDMQNPSSLGQMFLLVNQNGDVYPSDEARMISEMGYKHWKMGNVNQEDCLLTMQHKREEILSNGYLENYDECKSCVFSPFCYADPIKKWYIANIAGNEYEDYCGIRKELFSFVFNLLNNASAKQLELFRRWANV